MKKSVLLLIALFSMRAFAYDGEQVLNILEEGIHEGINQDGLCYVNIKTFDFEETKVVVGVYQSDTATRPLARFNELADFKTDSIDIVNNGLVYKIERKARGPLDADQKATLEIKSDSTNTEVYIEKKVKSFFGWRIEETASCIL